ncbi:MAG: hypothetical protein ABI142_13040 [Bryocella sp.]
MRVMALAMMLCGLLVGCQSKTDDPAVVPTRVMAAVKPVSAGVAADANLTTYRDPKTGVSFAYPKVWVVSADSPSYMGGALPPSYGEPRASFAFSPKGNLYEKTVLLGLVFSYAVKQAANEAACTEGFATMGNVDAGKRVTVNGIGFTEYVGGDAGMCHEQAHQIDVAYRDGQCVAFERDVNTECYGAGDGKRRLTEQEKKALQRHLDAVMQSVRVEK